MTAPDIGELADLWRGRRVVALTGAGISTESGIPDYRGEGTRARLRKPIQHGEFVGSAETRQRYWARSFSGWNVISGATPNAGHRALAALEERSALCGVITQNVDRLHAAAGSRNVIELHGALADVICLDCEVRTTRERVQQRLRELNPDWKATPGEARPDGDREISEAKLAGFVVADCEVCGGPLKPDVVFFGGAVAKDVVERAWSLYREAELLVVVGSSLAVFSGYRFVRQAGVDAVDVAIVNRGPTRGDEVACLKLETGAGDTLSELNDLL